MENNNENKEIYFNNNLKGIYLLYKFRSEKC